MVNRDKSILCHIIEYCEDIIEFVDRFGKDYEIFINDRAYFSAVSMCILQIGELSGNLSEDFRKYTSDKIPWSSIRGMRNIVVHDYGSLDEQLVWETAIYDIPSLLTICKYELNQMDRIRDEER